MLTFLELHEVLEARYQQVHQDMVAARMLDRWIANTLMAVAAHLSQAVRSALSSLGAWITLRRQISSPRTWAELRGPQARDIL